MLFPKLFTVVSLAFVTAAVETPNPRLAVWTRIDEICSPAVQDSAVAAECATLSSPTMRSMRLQPRNCPYVPETVRICIGGGACQIIETKSRCDVCYDSENSCYQCNNGGNLGHCFICLGVCDNRCC